MPEYKCIKIATISDLLMYGLDQKILVDYLKFLNQRAFDYSGFIITKSIFSKKSETISDYHKEIKEFIMNNRDFKNFLIRNQFIEEVKPEFEPATLTIETEDEFNLIYSFISHLCTSEEKNKDTVIHLKNKLEKLNDWKNK